MEFDDPRSTQLFDLLKDGWDKIDAEVYTGGYPHAHMILALDDLINWEREYILQAAKDKGTEPDFGDLNSLVQYHNHRRAWLDRTTQLRSEFVHWWSEQLTSQHNLLQSEASQSRRLVLLVHGAALLGSMTALGTIENTAYAASFRGVAVGALIGFILAIIGQVIWLECYGGTIGKLRGDFRTTQTMRRLRSYGAYLRRRWKNEVVWSFRFTYASVIAFPLYAVVALSLAWSQ